MGNFREPTLLGKIMDKETSERVIKLASSWFYSFRNISYSIRQKWTDNLSALFGDQIPKSSLVRISLRNDKQIDENDLEVILTALALLSVIREDINSNYDLSTVNKIDSFISEQGNKHQIDKQKIFDLKSVFQSRIEQYSGRLPIKVPTSIIPLTVDCIARWILIWNLPNYTLYWFTSNLVLPSVILLYSYFVSSKSKNYNLKLIEKHGNENDYKLVNTRTTSQFTALSLLILIGIALAANSAPTGSSIFLVVTSTVSYFIYYLIYFGIYATRKISEKDLIAQLQTSSENQIELNPDENDELIIQHESRLKSISGRLEVYVLESALFGALAFSAFIQIMAENLVSLDTLSEFVKHIQGLLSGLVVLDGNLLKASLGSLSSMDDLFALIAVETLVCSMFFLIVIASRLKYSDVSDQVVVSIELSRSYNEKAHRIFENSDQTEVDENRLSNYNDHIFKSLRQTKEGLEAMEPITAFMRYFRNGGIMVFIVVLISSALFISTLLSWIFLILGLLSVMYFSRHELLLFAQKIVFDIRRLVLNSGIYLLLFAILSFTLGFYLKVELNTPGTDYLLLLGFVLTGFYLFSLISIVPHEDKLFDQNHEKVDLESGSWNIIKFIWGLSVFFAILGYALMIINLGQATSILGFSSVVMMVIFLVIGPRLTHPKWLGLVTAVSVDILIAGFLLKSLHYPGAALLMAIGCVGGLIVIIVFFIKSAPKISSGLFSLCLCLLFIGTFLRIMHLPFGWQLTLVGIIGLPISIWFLVKRPILIRVFHKLFAFSILIILFLSITQIDKKSYISKMYNLRTINITNIQRTAYTLTISDQLLDALVDQQKEPEQIKDRIEAYMEDVKWLNEFCSERESLFEIAYIVEQNYNLSAYILLNYEDLHSLEIGLKLAQQAFRLDEQMIFKSELYKTPIGAYYGINQKSLGHPYYKIPSIFLEPLILKKLDRIDDMKGSLQRIENSHIFDENIFHDLKSKFLN